VPELRSTRSPQPRRLLPPPFRHRARRSRPSLRSVRPCARRTRAACATPRRPV